MSRTRPLVLRLPRMRGGTKGHDCCEVRGSWMESLRGLARGLCVLGHAESLRALSSHTGQSGLWIPSQKLADAAWSDTGWGRTAWMSEAEWAHESVEAMNARWSAKPGDRPERLWRSEGWAWCPERRCWMAQVFVKSGGAPLRMRMQPAALTVWQWDRDPFDEMRFWELEHSDLESMAEGMRVRAIEELADGANSLPGNFMARERLHACLSLLRVRAESVELGEGCVPCEISKEGPARI